MPSFKLASSALALTFATTALAQNCSTTCQSFGVDFVSGGTYFQDSNSPDPFTAVQEFEGCQDDTADNILVDPNGDEYQCSNTPLTPDDTPETITCPIDKDQLYSGDWSLIIISNNGNCAPIAFERDFSLSVGPQSTVTVSAEPTITISTTTTPQISTTITSTQILTSTANPVTSTVAKYNYKPTITIQPLPLVTVITKALLTLTPTSLIPTVVATSIAEATASCKLPQRQYVEDPVASHRPTVLASLVQKIFSELGLSTLSEREAELPQPTARSASTDFKRAIIEGRAIEPKVKSEYLAARRERMALNKRAPDLPTTTITGLAGATYTVTDVISAAATTLTGYTTLVQTTTTTPIVTVSKGMSVSVVKVTATRRTISNTLWIPAATILQSKTTGITLSVTSTVTPAGASASCASLGGILS